MELFIGGHEGNRTHYHRIHSAALLPLSYTPHRLEPGGRSYSLRSFPKNRHCFLHQVQMDGLTEPERNRVTE